MVKMFVFVSFLACAVAVSTGVSTELSSDNTRSLRGAVATATEAEAATSFSAEHNTHAMLVRAEMESRIRQYQREHPRGFWAMEARAKALNAPHERMPAVVMEAKHRAASAAKMQATTGTATRGMVMEAHRAQHQHDEEKTAMEAKFYDPVADKPKFKTPSALKVPMPDAGALRKSIKKFTAKKGPVQPEKGTVKLEAQHIQGDSNYLGLGNAQSTGKKLYKTGGGP